MGVYLSSKSVLVYRKYRNPYQIKAEMLIGIPGFCALISPSSFIYETGGDTALVIMAPVAIFCISLLFYLIDIILSSTHKHMSIIKGYNDYIDSISDKKPEYHFLWLAAPDEMKINKKEYIIGLAIGFVSYFAISIIEAYY